jgi:hypothetical protein
VSGRTINIASTESHASKHTDLNRSTSQPPFKTSTTTTRLQHRHPNRNRSPLKRRCTICRYPCLKRPNQGTRKSGKKGFETSRPALPYSAQGALPETSQLDRLSQLVVLPAETSTMVTAKRDQPDRWIECRGRQLFLSVNGQGPSSYTVQRPKKQWSGVFKVSNLHVYMYTCAMVPWYLQVGR